MSIAVLVLLAVTAAGGLVLTARGERVRPYWAGAILAALLAVAAVVAWAADTPADGLCSKGSPSPPSPPPSWAAGRSPPRSSARPTPPPSVSPEARRIP